MAENLDQSDGLGDKHAAARRLAEQAVQAQAEGEDEQAERLFAEAERIDPDAVIAVLGERAGDPDDTATGADAEPQNDEEIAAMSRTIQPGADAPSRAGISGRGSGADG